MTLPAKWKHAKAGLQVPVSLAEVDRLESMFGGAPNEDSPEASLFWARAATRRGDNPLFSHVLFLRNSEEGNHD
jgi:hypothetical protein